MIILRLGFPQYVIKSAQLRARKSFCSPSRVVKDKKKILVVPSFVKSLNEVRPSDILPAASISTNIRRILFPKHSLSEKHKAGIYKIHCKSRLLKKGLREFNFERKLAQYR